MDSQATTLDEEDVVTAPLSSSPQDGDIPSSPSLTLKAPSDRGSPTSSQRFHSALDLSSLPPTFVFPTHFESEELHDLELKLIDDGLPLTYDTKEAQLFLGKIEKPRRAILELKARGITSESYETLVVAERPVKRRKLAKGETFEVIVIDSDDEVTEKDVQPLDFGDEQTVMVVKHTWIDASAKAGRLLPLRSYVVYSGRRVTKVVSPTMLPRKATKLDIGTGETFTRPRNPYASDSSGTATEHDLQTRRSKPHKRPHLPTQTTSEHDMEGVPPLPAWVTKGLKYACQRRSPIDNPNDAFIEQLKAIRLARELQSDQIGVRAYSTAIAAIAAYPNKIVSSVEVALLPGCQGKIKALFEEFDEVGSLTEAREAEKDGQMKILKLFYDIWGVGSITAREFYAKGWKDLDDVVEYGWADLSRVQQIGLKYYDEFKLKMSRSEVESIHDIIVSALHHIVRSRDGDADGVRSCIVGGYRRGKLESGDVDVIVSHCDEDETLDIITPLVEHLYALGYVTHNLGVTLSSTRRGQKTLPFIGGTRSAGHGFDSLDKALVVWQDMPEPSPPRWRSMTGDEKAAWRKQNPSNIPHRRVDIIVSPWSTIGCAVLGWSAGTTFERDLRRYAKHTKSWKFDSSGVRDRVSGKAVDLERRKDGRRAATADEAERLVFEGLGLEFIPPMDRCTG